MELFWSARGLPPLLIWLRPPKREQAPALQKGMRRKTPLAVHQASAEFTPTRGIGFGKHQQFDNPPSSPYDLPCKGTGGWLPRSGVAGVKGNPVRIRNGPAAVTELQACFTPSCHCRFGLTAAAMRRLEARARKSEDLPVPTSERLREGRSRLARPITLEDRKIGNAPGSAMV